MQDMDEDVKLSMQQAHRKWVIKVQAAGLVLLLGTLTLWIYDCDSERRAAPCSDVVIDSRSPPGGTVQCPDTRQKLTFPPGWTWIKCSCPDTAQK